MFMQLPSRLFSFSLASSWPEIYDHAFGTSFSDSHNLLGSFKLLSPFLIAVSWSGIRYNLLKNCFQRQSSTTCWTAFKWVSSDRKGNVRLVMHCSNSSCFSHRAAVECLWGNDKKHEYLCVVERYPDYNVVNDTFSNEENAKPSKLSHARALSAASRLTINHVLSRLSGISS